MNAVSLKLKIAAAAFAAGSIAWNTAAAGGISLYEVGTADVGLASAGYSARAQDAATVFTNPAGMTRLAGDQLTLGAQMLYADLGFSIAQAMMPALGSNAGGNPVGWFPGGGVFYSHSVSPDIKVGLAHYGNFGSAVKYDEGWVGRYRAQEGTLLGVSILPSAAWRVNENLSVGASLNAMYGKLKNVVAVNNIVGADGSLSLDDNAWGFGANMGLLYEMDRGTRFGITYNSPVNLNFRAQTQWEGLGPRRPGFARVPRIAGCQCRPRRYGPARRECGLLQGGRSALAVLGSVGWQQWSKFGQVDVGVDSNNPIGLTTRLDFKDTWHVAGGAQYRLSDAWLLNGGLAYDSGFQDNSSVALALPANAAWRFGVGGQNEVSPIFNWGWSLEYLYGGNLHTNITGSAPVALGGRGDVVGSFNSVDFLFFAANLNWKF